ncbi:hypothetical protein OPT61_g6697 [Boeremia exigua]|uniref:Uncharacterized protein n=1 Tax=Boeremia exigua TaxID=749465 RepID=A0ACC2I684_9PLEO|nr:hypothetical protein OPT61_g6697 [Boeremia exigua]
MSSQTVSASASEETFFSSLSRAFPTDQAEECPICKDTYIDKENEPVTTKCGHTFHSQCLRTWLKSPTGQATCPMCRAKLFDKKHSDPPGWEGLSVAYDEMIRFDMWSFFFDHVWLFWPMLGDWESVVVKIMNICVHPPSTARGFVMVASIIEALISVAEERNRDTEKFNNIVRILDEREENASNDGCTIEQAYEAAGLSHVIARIRA